MPLGKGLPELFETDFHRRLIGRAKQTHHFSEGEDESVSTVVFRAV